MISADMMKKLKEHSKKHTGGMSGKHMKNMVKFVKAGDSFSKAHSKAKDLDKPKQAAKKPAKKPAKKMVKSKMIKPKMVKSFSY